ncbi:hypothetical protein SEVIR_4G064500v4 [Setaria viridis]|uniref:Legume lectin domain-containing protein n=2 Tax=Setaria viridis TaxID=4556 RepID=A0A4U6UWD6_SETVI|nr:uncharacterized protein LOC117852061 [Setaria viridis]TKW20122.1 hypothetical protein SEVIR_4G064500v2 [Setaria viridis]
MAMASLSPLVHAVVLAAFFLRTRAAAQSRAANMSAVEAAVRDRALELLHGGGASQLVDVTLPSSLAGVGVEASALRVRSNALWADGVNATTGAGPSGVGFTIPPRVLPAPFARRVVIVFVRFVGGSNVTSAFAAPPGYALAAPVAGLLAFDASAGPDGARVSLRALGAPVRVEFKNLSSSSAAGKGFNATAARCVTFAAGGEVAATHAMASGTACAVTGTGNFGIAVRVAETPPQASASIVRARWWAWTVGVGAGGVVGASGLALSVAGAVSWSRRRRREEMERRAMAGEELGRMTVCGSRMPSAKVMRTQPEVEESPSWR